ncbi:MAG TPA: hypothetical protein VGP17_04005 [Solirubrobacteraceae bacterium]|jgi:hypothetical protein|nr:hypothetical protein [Solirubrobacteraceae bacterium]
MSTQAGQPTEEELRAYEEELSRITSTQLVIQAAASLLNVGGRRLGLAEGFDHERDLDQVCDAIDAVKVLLPILERRMPAAQTRPLRDALSQLQMAYARLSHAAPATAAPSAPAGAPEQPSVPAQPAAQGSGEPPSAPETQPAGQPPADASQPGPGPAESSGRLWVPGR